MNAKEGSTRPGALGRGLETLMGNEGEGAADAPEAPAASANVEARPGKEHSPRQSACLVGGLIASGAAGAVAIAAFSLLGVKAVLSMTRRW